MKKTTLILAVLGFFLCFNSNMIAQTRGESNGFQTVVKVVSNRLDTKVENYTTFYRNCGKTTYDCTGTGDLSCPEGQQEETCTPWGPNVP